MPDRHPGQEVDAIYRTVPIGLCVLDRDLRYVRVNDQLALINGVPAADHVGRLVSDLLPQLAQTLEPLLRRVLDSGEAIRHEEIVSAPGGDAHPRACVMHCVPIHGADGAVTGINVAVEEITEFLETQSRLRALEHQLWMQTENSPLAVIEWDSQYRITRWSGTAETMFGWRAEEVVGKRIDELSLVVDEDWPIVREAMAKLSSAQGRHVVSSNRNYTRDRRIIVCEWYNSIVRNSEGELSSVLSLVLDVTEQRRTIREQKLLGEVGHLLAERGDLPPMLAALTALPVPEFADWSSLDTIDARGSIDRRTIAWSAAPGSTSDVDLRTYQGSSLGLLPTLCGDEVLSTGRATIRSGCTCSGLREALAAEQANEFPAPGPAYSVLTVPFKIEEKIVAAWSWGRSRQEDFDTRDLALAEELARRVATRILNTRLLEAVQRTNRVKDQFFATLGHELRQPLGALTTALGILRVTPDSRAAERAWRVAERQLDVFTTLIEDLLDLSRIERGKITLAHDMLDLRQIVEAAIDVNEHLVRSRQQRLQFALPGGPIVVLGDPARLQQVFSNLLNNASKFTSGGGTIRVAVSVAAGQVHVSVRDSGRGIPPDQLEMIFEPFAQGVERAGDGLGIGLAVVRQLVELHGGRVQARSRGENQGSEFVVTLPLVESEHASATVETA